MLEFSTWHNLHLAFNGLPWAIGGTDCVLPCRAVTDCTWWCLLLTIFIFRCYTTYSELLPAWESGFCLWFLTCVSPLCNWHGWLGVTYPVSCQLGITVHDNHMGYIYIYLNQYYIYIFKLSWNTVLQKSLVLVVVGYGPGMHLIGMECMDWDLHWVCRGDCVLRPMLNVQGCAGVRVCWNLNCVCRGEHRLRHTVSMQGECVLRPLLSVQGWVWIETSVECTRGQYGLRPWILIECAGNHVD